MYYMLPAAHGSTNAPRNDGEAKVCAVLCDALIRENQRAVDDYLQFCNEQYVVPVLKLDEKQLHLFGSPTATTEAGRILLDAHATNDHSVLPAEKRFLELQNQLLLAKSQRGRDERAHWWYEAWDGTWQLYNEKMIAHIEQQHKSKRSSVSVRLSSQSNLDVNRWT